MSVNLSTWAASTFISTVRYGAPSQIEPLRTTASRIDKTVRNESWRPTRFQSRCSLARATTWVATSDRPRSSTAIIPDGSNSRVMTMSPNSVTPQVRMITGMTIRPRIAAAPNAIVEMMVFWIRRLIIWIASPCAQPTVHRDILTGDIGCRIGHQEQHGADHLVGARHAAERNARAITLLERIVLSALDAARGERVDAHALRAPVGGEVLCQPDNAGRGCGIDNGRVDRP